MTTKKLIGRFFTGRSRPKLCIIGYARSGKDTAAEVLEGYFGVKHTSSSMAAAKIFIFEKLKDKYGYKSFEECFEDRLVILYTPSGNCSSS